LNEGGEPVMAVLGCAVSTGDEKLHQLIQFRFCPRCGKEGLADHGHNAVSCSVCGYIYYHDSVAAVVAIVEYKDRIVVTRRANEPHKGMWAIPGGFVEFGESLEAALARELKEELNLEIDAPKYLASFASRYPFRDVLYFPSVAYFTTRIEDVSQMRPSDDVDRYRLTPPAQLINEELAFPADVEALHVYCRQRLGA
jgi:NAD+ diphosphatase